MEYAKLAEPYEYDGFMLPEFDLRLSVKQIIFWEKNPVSVKI